MREPRARIYQNFCPMLQTFLDYVRFGTTSDEASASSPSSTGQLRLAYRIAEELHTLGCTEVEVSNDGVLYAHIPASPGLEHVPPLGFIAHLDTSPDVPGDNVCPRVIRNYGGSPILLGDVALDPTQAPELAGCIGKTIITSDGTTLLGADDKAGLTILVHLARTLLSADAPPHPAVSIAFTPDEEIGRGVDHFQEKRFRARYAYTVDGSAPHIFECANFNAAAATFTFQGVNTHPGSAKGILRNAVKMAQAVLNALPPEECPEQTEDREGFYHPVGITGTVAAAKLELIIRDHSCERFEARKTFLRELAQSLCARYGAGTVTLELRDQYRNMEDALKTCPFLVDVALDAIREAGLTPAVCAIRGGTDGAHLSARGIPCPNLGTGGYRFHSLTEFACLEEMEQMLRIVLGIVVRWPDVVPASASAPLPA